jgi:riboflavin kinase / FMN adenylyltransferase
MRRHHHWLDIAAGDRGASVAMGNFDGVHLGHASVIAAAATHGPLGVVTFEPHPREFFSPDAPPFRLMNPATRAHRLERMGVAQLYELPFDARMAEFSPPDFVETVLLRGLGVTHVTVGQDFRFGKGRKGTAAELVVLGRTHGFGVTIAPLLAIEGLEVSSTAIRTALSEGRPRLWPCSTGPSMRCQWPSMAAASRGRDLGYPTANMAVAGLHLPRLGVYAVTVDVLSGPHAGSYKGAASLGVRPMFGENLPNLETFLFDFSGDLYGAELSVGFVDYLRPEMTFDGLPALIAQMEADCRKARSILDAL